MLIENKRIFISLYLRESMKIHNVFYFNLLQKLLTILLTNQVNKLQPPIIINNKEEWKVKSIFDTRSYQGKLQY